MATIKDVADLVHRFYENNPIHKKRGFRMSEADSRVITNHLIEEAVELQAAVLFDDLGNQVEESADLLLILFHMWEHQRISLSEVSARAITKLKDTWTNDRGQVTAKRPGFSRSGRADPER